MLHSSSSWKSIFRLASIHLFSLRTPLLLKRSEEGNILSDSLAAKTKHDQQDREAAERGEVTEPESLDTLFLEPYDDEQSAMLVHSRRIAENSGHPQRKVDGPGPCLTVEVLGNKKAVGKGT